MPPTKKLQKLLNVQKSRLLWLLPAAVTVGAMYPAVPHLENVTPRPKLQVKVVVANVRWKTNRSFGILFIPQA